MATVGRCCLLVTVADLAESRVALTRTRLNLALCSQVLVRRDTDRSSCRGMSVTLFSIDCDLHQPPLPIM